MTRYLFRLMVFKGLAPSTLHRESGRFEFDAANDREAKAHAESYSEPLAACDFAILTALPDGREVWAYGNAYRAQGA